MKKIILLLLVVSAFVFSQDTTVIATRAYHVDSLTTTKDTIDVAFRWDEMGFEGYTVVIYTSSGADTVNVYKQAIDGSRFVQMGLVNLASGAMVTAIPVTTSPVEYLIYGGESAKVRLISNSNDGSITRFILGGKKLSPVY